MKGQYLKECSTIENNCTYTAEAHHIIATDSRCLSTKLQIVPAIIASLSGLLVVGKLVPEWWGWLTVLSATISAVAGVIDPTRTYYEHLNAAKNFTVIKQKAHSLRETFSHDMTDKELNIAVRILHDQYCDLIRCVPPTDDEAFEKARKRIQDGVHQKD